MAMDLFRRTAQIIGQGAVEYGKSYLETPVELINDVNEVKDNIIKGGKDVGQIIAKMKTANGTPLKRISDWFYGRGEEYGGDDELLSGDSGDDFDAGFKSDSDEGSKAEATVLDRDSMKSLTKSQVGAMYQIGGKQVEAGIANTASLISTINTRSAELLASVNAVNTSIIAVGKKLDDLTKLFTAAEEDKRKASQGSGVINAQGKISLSGLATAIMENAKQSDAGTILSMIPMMLSQGPVGLASMGFDALGNKIKIGDKTFNKWAETINEGISNAVDSLLRKAVTGGLHGNGIIGKITDFLGFGNLNTEWNKNFANEVKNEYTRDRATFDGITRHTIVSVIPAYLREITTALTGTRYNVSDKGKLTTKDTDYFGRAAYRDVMRMTSTSTENKDKMNSRLSGRFSSSEITAAERALVAAYVIVLSDRNEKTVANLLDLKDEAIAVAEDIMATSKSGTANRSDWEACFNVILGTIMADDTENRRFMEMISKRKASININGTAAATSGNESLTRDARTLTHKDQVKLAAVGLDDYNPYQETQYTDQQKKELERLRQQIKELEEKQTFGYESWIKKKKAKIQEIEEEAESAKYSEAKFDRIGADSTGKSLPSLVNDILTKLHDVIDVRIVGYGSDAYGGKGRRKRGRGPKPRGGPATTITSPTSGAPGPVSVGSQTIDDGDNDDVLDTAASTPSKTDQMVNNGIDTVNDVAEKIVDRVTSGFSTVQAKFRSPYETARNAIQTEGSNLGSDLRRAGTAIMQSRISDARHQDIVQTGINNADKVLVNGGISDADKQNASLAMSMMQAALQDGDGKADLSNIKNIINQIDNPDLKKNLNKSITQMINRSEANDKAPAKSKLGKILMWALGGLKTLFAPVLKVVKGLAGTVAKGFKTIGKYILKYFSNAAAGIVSGVGSIGKGLFGQKEIRDEDGDIIQQANKGLIRNTFDLIRAKRSSGSQGTSQSTSSGGQAGPISSNNGIQLEEINEGGSNRQGRPAEQQPQQKPGIGGAFDGMKAKLFGTTVDADGNTRTLSFAEAFENSKFGQSAFGQGLSQAFRDNDKLKGKFADALGLGEANKVKTMADAQTKKIADAINEPDKNPFFGKVLAFLDSISTNTKVEADAVKKQENENSGEAGPISSEDGTPIEGKVGSSNKPEMDSIDLHPSSSSMELLDMSGAKPLAPASGGGGVAAMESIAVPSGGTTGMLTNMLGGAGGGALSALSGPMQAIGNSLGAMSGGILTIATSVLKVVMGMEGLKKIMNIGTEILQDGLAPINDLFESIYKLIKPIAKILSDTIKGLVKPLTDAIQVILDVIAPILDALFKPISEVLSLITNVLSPAVSIIANVVKVIAGALGVGLGYTIKALGTIATIIGGIQKILSFGLAGDAVTAIAKAASSIGDVLVNFGKETFKEGLQGISDGISDIVAEVNTFVENIKGEGESNTKERLWDQTETYNGSVMDGLMGAGDTYNYYYRNMYGSGNTTTSQVNYGSYMNMKDRGCGPIALADAYSRRTGGSVNPVSLASKMRGAGTYDVNRGTSVGGMINAGRAMGMNLTPGGVTYQSIRHASANNPITLVGSGDGFGTRKGNMHYMNVVGSDKSGRALVSNPLNGRVSRIPIGSLTNNSVLGLYGSGDTDFASKYHFPDAISDLISTLKDFASGFISMFTGKSEKEQEIERQNQAASLKNLKSQLGNEKYAEVEARAKEQWMQMNPQKPGESDAAYNARWEKEKSKYILSNSVDDLQGMTERSGMDPNAYESTLTKIFEDSGYSSYSEFEDQIYGDFDKSADASKKWSEWQQSTTAAANGSSLAYSGGRRGRGAEDLIKSTAMVFEGYINSNANGTYINGLYNSPITLRSGRSRKIRPDCSGMISAGIQELGYSLKDAGEYGVDSWTFLNNAKSGTNTLVLDPETGQPSSDWVVMPFSPETLKRGDITIVGGHVSMPVENLTASYPRGMDAGGSENIRLSAAAAKQYLNGDSTINWYSAMGSGAYHEGQGATYILRYLGRPGSGQGYIEPSELMKKYSLWSSLGNKLTASDYHEQAMAAGITPGEEAYIAGVGMVEDGALKLIGQKSLTKVVHDTDSHPYAFGISNWTPSAGKVAGDDEYMYGSTVKEQIERGFAPNYFGDNPSKPRARITSNIDGYRSALEQVLGYPLALNQGDLWGNYLDTDLAEATGHGVGNAVVPGSWQTPEGHAKYIGSAVDYYNWLVDIGYVNPESDNMTYYTDLATNNSATVVDRYDDSNVQNATANYYRDKYVSENYDGKVAGMEYNGTNGLFIFRNANNEPLFSAYCLTGDQRVNSNVQSAIDKQYKTRYKFNFNGYDFVAYEFNNTGPSQAAKSLLEKNGKIQVNGTVKYGSSVNISDSQKKSIFPAYNPNSGGTVARASYDEDYSKQLYAQAKVDEYSNSSYYRNLRGSGDAEMIPEIDNSKLSTINDLLGWQTDAETGNTVNQYYITRDSSTYDMIQAVLHNTFEVRSESIEALLQQLLDEIRAKKSKASTSKSGSPQDMFNNHDIPPQIKRLALG